ncbi:MAG: ABC transporter ATP-binding protein [Bacteroidia bacterium]|nr:ABC transporter ATP-binding protein [Bacteroidia bacterium]
MILGKDLHKKYGELEVLKGVDIHIKPSEVVSIVGSSGAGKTTLLTILGTLDRASKGDLLFDGVNIMGLSERKLAAFRNQNIGFVFQFHHLLPEFTAIENVCIPAYINKTSKKLAEAKALELLDLLGVKQRANHKPTELSGGEQQRVAVARALINNPKVIFADEPSGNLDSENAQKLHQLFFTLRDNLKQTIVVVTHNEVLADMADRKLVMKDGLIQA